VVQDSGDSAIEALARWADELRFEDIPVSVVETSKHLMLDTMGVAVAATTDPVGAAILRWTADFASPGPAAVIGASRRVAPVDAALANGTLAHALDYDDHGFGGHASACVLPAVLAAGQSGEVDGRQLLTAYVAGMEAFGRLATCTHVPNIHEHGFHPTAVLGLVGASVAVAKVLDRPVDEIAEAVTVGSSWGVGFTANFGTTVKPLHAGHTAASGVQAVQLATSGFTGNRQLFETRHGFGAAYMRDDPNWETFKEAIAGPFRLTVRHPSIKQWPCCGGNQRSIQNLSRIMREHGLEDGDVAKVELHINPRQLTSLRYSWPTTAYEAKFCLPFTVAVTLAKGAPTIAAFRDGWWDDPLVLAARDRIELIQDGVGDKNQVTVTVFTHDGRELSRSEWVVHGSAGDPMTRDEVSAKYLDSCSYGVLDDDVVRGLHDATLAMEDSGKEFWRAWEAVTYTA
jgi:2-methylcitrate dehydratase PrpD